jgi:hypothetical protein
MNPACCRYGQQEEARAAQNLAGFRGWFAGPPAGGDSHIEVRSCAKAMVGAMRTATEWRTGGSGALLAPLRLHERCGVAMSEAILAYGALGEMRPAERGDGK